LPIDWANSSKTTAWQQLRVTISNLKETEDNNMAKPQQNSEEMMHDQTHSQSPIKETSVAETLKRQVSEQLKGSGDAELMHDQTHDQTHSKG
jgi:hypothetical protein